MADSKKSLKMVPGLVTLMSAVEYGVKLPHNWQDQLTDGFFKCFLDDEKTPFAINMTGILMITPVSQKKYDAWTKRREELEAAQEARYQEMKAQEEKMRNAASERAPSNMIEGI